MTKVALRGLAGRKLRALLTAIAIVLGVAMISGTFILTDTIRSAFDNLFDDVYEGTDAVVKGKTAFETDFSLPPPIDEDLLDTVREQPSVRIAAGSIEDFATLTDRDGDAITTGGAPNLAFGGNPDDQEFNPLVLVEGEWASGPGEIVIDAGTADGENFEIGDTIGVAAKGPLEEFTIVGIARFGSVDSIGGATFAVFDVPTAQELFDKEGLLDSISAAAAQGVTPEELAAELSQALPDSVEVLTGVEQAEEDTQDVDEFVSFIQYFLLAFGGIALFVGAFVIFNTLSITVAQRTREFAVLRTIGASRRQVLGGVVIEAFVIGLLASVVGLFLGFGLAAGLDAVFVALGVDLPSTDTVFATRTIIVSLVAGVVVTLAAGLFPAVRATKVPPIAAVREGATLPPGRLARWSPVLSVLTTVIAIVVLVYGMFAPDVDIQNRLIAIGVGCIVLFIGVALISSRVVRPLASVLGWPARRFAGAAGRLARENSMRNPGRTASTAAALMIGLALITFVAVLAQGLRSSVSDAIEEQVTAEFVVVSEDGFTPFDPSPDDTLAQIDGVEAVGVRGERGRADASEQNVTGVDPESIANVYAFDWVEGSDESLAELASDGALVEDGFADDHDLSLGSRFGVQSPAGRTIGVRVAGIYAAPPFWQMLGDVTISQAAFDETFEAPRNLYTFVNAEGGATAENEVLLSAALDDFPNVQLDTKQGFIEFQQSQIDPLLNLLFVLLALSVIVSLFGIVNTLVLSVFERTRELGMLRAVGMTRRQVRRMIRQESIITALIGAALGMALGFALAILITVALRDEGLVFAVPIGTLIAFVVVAILAGVLAAILPARRASRLNVLEALQYE